jgi:hypothetical protein
VRTLLRDEPAPPLSRSDIDSATCDTCAGETEVLFALYQSCQRLNASRAADADRAAQVSRLQEELNCAQQQSQRFMSETRRLVALGKQQDELQSEQRRRLRQLEQALVSFGIPIPPARSTASKQALNIAGAGSSSATSLVIGDVHCEATDRGVSSKRTRSSSSANHIVNPSASPAVMDAGQSKRSERNAPMVEDGGFDRSLLDPQSTGVAPLRSNCDPPTAVSLHRLLQPTQSANNFAYTLSSQPAVASAPALPSAAPLSVSVGGVQDLHPHDLLAQRPRARHEGEHQAVLFAGGPRSGIVEQPESARCSGTTPVAAVIESSCSPDDDEDAEDAQLAATLDAQLVRQQARLSADKRFTACHDGRGAAVGYDAVGGRVSSRRPSAKSSSVHALKEHAYVPPTRARIDAAGRALGAHNVRGSVITAWLERPATT